MKAGCHGLAPTQVSSPPERGLATNRDKNNKMKIAPNELLKTKGQKSAPNEFMKISELSRFRYYFMIHKELAAVSTLRVRHPPQSGWLDEWGRLKGGHPVV
jgi:hypothetical protein